MRDIWSVGNLGMLTTPSSVSVASAATSPHLLHLGPPIVIGLDRNLPADLCR